MGADKNEILEKLHITGKNESVYFHELIISLSKQIEPLGLFIRYNPIDSHWFVSFDSNVSNLISANPFEDKPKLAATLFCVLTLALSNLGRAKISEIKQLRKKKGILKDLKELEQFGYLTIDNESKEVSLTPLVGYQLDLPKLFMKLSLKLKNDEKLNTDTNKKRNENIND
ncbi:MAG: hypothetical protein BAJALOKI1v1_540017 [Promethearchaeota archaeon]|nr:MAG: hypothetical protein BAJALOKI1v1_540017 [Candidatus Lokiarchaeota archaeon]